MIVNLRTSQMCVDDEIIGISSCFNVRGLFTEMFDNSWSYAWVWHI